MFTSIHISQRIFQVSFVGIQMGDEARRNWKRSSNRIREYLQYNMEYIYKYIHLEKCEKYSIDRMRRATKKKYTWIRTKHTPKQNDEFKNLFKKWMKKKRTIFNTYNVSLVQNMHKIKKAYTLGDLWYKADDFFPLHFCHGMFNNWH